MLTPMYVKRAAEIYEAARIQEEESIEHFIALELQRLLAVAQGCHDYGGGYFKDHDREVFHHGIQTVFNALEASATKPNIHAGAYTGNGRDG